MRRNYFFQVIFLCILVLIIINGHRNKKRMTPVVRGDSLMNVSAKDNVKEKEATINIIVDTFTFDPDQRKRDSLVLLDAVKLNYIERNSIKRYLMDINLLVHLKQKMLDDGNLNYYHTDGSTFVLQPMKAASAKPRV